MKRWMIFLIISFFVSSFSIQAMEAWSDDDQPVQTDPAQGDDESNIPLIEQQDEEKSEGVQEVEGETGPYLMVKQEDGCESALVQEVKRALAEKKDLNKEDEHSRVLLHYAACNNDYFAAMMLISHGAFVDYENLQSETPLSLSKQGSEVQKLLSANLELLNVFTQFRPAEMDNPRSQFQQYPSIFNLDYSGILASISNKLTQRAYINAKNVCGETLLHKVLEFNNPVLIQTLLNFRANRLIRDGDGMTPLNRAVFKRYFQVIPILLLNPFGLIDVGVDEPDNNGKTPLYWAIDYEDVHVVEMLLNAGAKPGLRVGTNVSPYVLAGRQQNSQIDALLDQWRCVIS